MKQALAGGTATGARRRSLDIQLDRHEAKYIIPRRQCRRSASSSARSASRTPTATAPAPSTRSPRCSSTRTTMRCTGPRSTKPSTASSCASAPTGSPGESPVFLEIKRKYQGHHRQVPRQDPVRGLGRGPRPQPAASTSLQVAQEETGFLEFVRLVREIGARPVC